MYKQFLLLFCLLAFISPVEGQQRTPGMPGEHQVRPATPILSKEQIDYLRPLAQAILEKQNSRTRVASKLDQHSLRANALVGFSDLMQDDNLRKYSPFGPNIEYGPMGPIGEEQRGRPGASVQPNLDGSWSRKSNGHPLDGVIANLDEVGRSTSRLNLNQGVFQQLDVSTNEAINALHHLRQPTAASTKPFVVPLAEPVLTPLASPLPTSVRGTNNTARAAGRLKLRDLNTLARAVGTVLGSGPSIIGVGAGIGGSACLVPTSGGPRNAADRYRVLIRVLAGCK